MKTEEMIRAISFDEDNFDLEAYKRITGAMTMKKKSAKRVRRQISVGKFFIAILALVVFLAICYILMDIDITSLF